MSRGPRRGSADGSCPIGRTVDILGDRWTLLILRNATLGMTRFDEFKRELQIADNVLADRLSNLVDHGLLARFPYRPEGKGRVRDGYRLTPAGEETLPILHALMTWGNAHSKAAQPTGPMRSEHTVCGASITLDGRCPTCGTTVPRSEIAWVRPWRDNLAHPIGMAPTPNAN
ncbi:helix-turn-helix domain-containing protein [Streptomyces sp. NPDC048409]|uniref:winged helix-turn-helix transcriptional regulator n=1 Tax=Streptomyces sp. NPDC048409 TaxID=3154723 RepID=UPI00341F4AEB